MSLGAPNTAGGNGDGPKIPYKTGHFTLTDREVLDRFHCLWDLGYMLQVSLRTPLQLTRRFPTKVQCAIRRAGTVRLHIDVHGTTQRMVLQRSRHDLAVGIWGSALTIGKESAQHSQYKWQHPRREVEKFFAGRRQVSEQHRRCGENRRNAS